MQCLPKRSPPGLEHIAEGLRQWAQAQRAILHHPTGPVPADSGDRLVKVNEAAQIRGDRTSTIHTPMNEGRLKKHEHTGHIAGSELDRFIRESSRSR
jgi:hypothetical protein